MQADDEPSHNAIVDAALDIAASVAAPDAIGATALGLIVSWFRSRTWTHDAACRGTDVDVFFPPRGAGIREARTLCHGCPVRDRCAAESHHVVHGVWADTSPHDRRRTRSSSRPPTETVQVAG